jgi:serine/threonine protein kinase
VESQASQSVAEDFEEEASDALANDNQHAEFYLDPVECISYDELEFIEHLGSGEFGTVCRGRFKHKDVAIKQLFWDNTMQEDAVLTDLAKEVESFRHLRHKRLVTFIGACLEIPHPCLVTEYMPGGSLHHLLHVRRMQLPLLHGINMCMQLADGVRYLHSQDPVVVHRDLKTQNVVLDLNLNIKLCDFGLTESMERTHITKKNNGGSPRYMAPELFDCRTKITEKVDLWAMGCIFIEIFGGTLPYEEINSLAELTRELLVHKRPPSIPGHIPDHPRQIIRGCHNFDFRLRPSANGVFEQLGECKKYMRQVGALPDGVGPKSSCRCSEPGKRSTLGDRDRARSRRSRTAGAGA